MGRICTSLIVFASLIIFGAVPARAENITVKVGVGDTTVTVSGRTSPSAFVTLLSNGTIIGTTTANNAGDFSHTFTAFPPGIAQIGAYADDLQGRSTSPVYKEISVAEHTQTTVEFFLPSTVAIDNPTVLVGAPITMQGATVPDGSVVILVDDTTRATVTADTDGLWHYVLETTGMTAENHTIYTIVNDLTTAEQSYPSAKISITLLSPDSIAPFLPPLTPAVVVPDIPTITYPIDGSTIEGSTLTVRGQAEPGTRIELFNGPTIIGSTFANSSHEWEITISLGDPSYTIRAKACRLLTCSDFSSPVHFFWRSSGQLGKGLFIFLEQYWFLIPQHNSVIHNVHISGGQAPYATTIDWGDGSTEKLDGENILLTLNHKYAKAGQFTGTVTVSDKNGVVATQTFTVEVVAPFWNYPKPLLLSVALLILLSVFAIHHWYKKKHKR